MRTSHTQTNTLHVSMCTHPHVLLYPGVSFYLLWCSMRCLLVVRIISCSCNAPAGRRTGGDGQCCPPNRHSSRRDYHSSPGRGSRASICHRYKETPMYTYVRVHLINELYTWVCMRTVEDTTLFVVIGDNAGVMLVGGNRNVQWSSYEKLK